MNHYTSTSTKHLKFVQKLVDRNRRYKLAMYIKEEYTRSHDKLLFECSNGHQRRITAYSVTNGTGCAICSGKAKRTTAEYIKYLSTHTNWQLIDGEEYINGTTKLKVKCKRGHVRNISPDIIISQNVGCAVCNKKVKKTKDSFLLELNIKRKYNGMQCITIKDGQIYINNKTAITFICANGHEWNAYPGSILYQLSDCPSCHQKHYSKKAIDWLNQLAYNEGITIQHAENGGEFAIPSTRFKADGYCKKTNTVYEFHGNKFHGNLTIYKPTDHCHPYDTKVTALELYEKTIHREQIISDLGYNLVVKWEDA